MASLKVSVRRYKHSPTAKWVVGYKHGQKRKREFFPTKAEAETRAEQVRIELQNLGAKAFEIGSSLRFEAMDCSAKLEPFGRTLTEAVDHFIAHLRATERSCTVQELVTEYTEGKGQRGLSSRHLGDLASRLGRFARTFGSAIVSEVSAKQIDVWLTGLALKAQSTNNYRTVLNSLFNYGKKLGYVTVNPMTGIERHKTTDAPPSILLPEELRQLLEASPSALVPYIAIGAFAGLRSAELDRLAWSDVRLGRGHIEVSAAKAKSRQRRLVDVCEALQDWIRPFVQESGPVKPTNCRKLLDAAWSTVFTGRKRDNDLRHSFASYHLALHGDAAKTALQLGHGDTGMLFKHYRELVTKDDAEAYFSVKPDGERNVVPMPKTA